MSNIPQVEKHICTSLEVHQDSYSASIYCCSITFTAAQLHRQSGVTDVTARELVLEINNHLLFNVTEVQNLVSSSALATLVHFSATRFLLFGNVHARFLFISLHAVPVQLHSTYYTILHHHHHHLKRPRCKPVWPVATQSKYWAQRKSLHAHWPSRPRANIELNANHYMLINHLLLTLYIYFIHTHKTPTSSLTYYQDITTNILSYDI